jgi:hypothetical protein
MKQNTTHPHARIKVILVNYINIAASINWVYRPSYVINPECHILFQTLLRRWCPSVILVGLKTIDHHIWRFPETGLPLNHSCYFRIFDYNNQDDLRNHGK